MACPDGTLPTEEGILVAGENPVGENPCSFLENPLAGENPCSFLEQPEAEFLSSVPLHRLLLQRLGESASAANP